MMEATLTSSCCRRGTRRDGSFWTNLTVPTTLRSLAYYLCWIEWSQSSLFSFCQSSCPSSLCFRELLGQGDRSRAASANLLAVPEEHKRLDKASAASTRPEMQWATYV